MEFKQKHIISMRSLSRDEITHILHTAALLKEKACPDLLRGKIIASLFFEPSTRTRLSFESAVCRLGGRILSLGSSEISSLSKGESFSDTIRMIESYSDLIVIRHPADGAASLASQIVDIPVINAGDGSNQHPTQTLLDLFTIQEAFGSLEGKKIAFIGDLKYGRTVHSLSRALSLFGAEMFFISPPSLELPEYMLSELEDRGTLYHVLESFDDILPEIDILYMTRIQEERFPDEEDFEKVRNSYVLNRKNVLGRCKKEAVILHPLPRVNEISTDLDDTPHARYFRQAANGVPVRKALLALCTGAPIPS